MLTIGAKCVMCGLQCFTLDGVWPAKDRLAARAKEAGQAVVSLQWWWEERDFVYAAWWLSFAVILGLLVAVALLSAGADAPGARRTKAARRRLRVRSLLTTILFEFGYIPLLSGQVKILGCIERDGRWVLQFDPATECFGSAHHTTLAYVTFALSLLSAGGGPKWVRETHVSGGSCFADGRHQCVCLCCVS